MRTENPQEQVAKPSFNTGPIPLKELFGYQAFNWPRYSPCGRYYTFLAPTHNGATTLWIQEEGKSARPLIPSGQRPLTNYTWLKNSTHIVFVADITGEERNQLYLCTVATGEVISLSPFTDARVLPYYFLSATQPDCIVFQCNNRTLTEYDVLKYCIRTATWEVLAQNPGNVLRWYVDNNLEVRARSTWDTDGIVRLATRLTNTTPWVVQATWQPEDTYTSRPLFFSPDNTYFYFADTTKTNTNTLQRVHIATGQVEILFNDPEHDAYHEAMLTDILDKAPPHASTLWGADGSIAAFSYFKERLAWVFLQPIDPALQAFLKDSSGEAWLEYQDATHFILGRCSSNAAPEFWHFDRKTSTFTLLGKARPELEKYHLSKTFSVSTRTADGFVVHGYLTLPIKKTEGPSPLVLKIHGGPWTRDTYGFSPEIAMLTSNGFACLQVNYRGSTGYGKTFASASCKQFGTAMVDDVIHLMRHVLAHYPLDTTRIAYMGRSYGGYSALTGGRRYQELFKAVVAQVPPTDLAFFIESYPPHWAMFKDLFCHRIGHPLHDRDLMHQQSPIAHAGGLTLPTMISYGQHDSRVVPAHIERYKKDMHQSPHNRIIYFENEGHFTMREANLLHQWEEALSFLKTHLG